MTSAEAKRLEALYALEILDTPREERFDRITRTAVRLFRMPNSLLAFVDETRAWVKSEVGTSIDWVPRESSFSELAIESDEPVVVPDAGNDPRFVDHPLVVGPDRIRSLAAHPLRTPDGYRVGALLVMDSNRTTSAKRSSTPSPTSAVWPRKSWRTSSTRGCSSWKPRARPACGR